jgi:Raf kinase inhibitor-like YbhB/YbcL family protein
MKITSPAFQNNTIVPVKYTCKGPNINPPFEIAEVSTEAKSLVFTVEDINATPIPWVHWLLFNIPPSTARIEEGTVPSNSIEGYANGGTPGYEGPCPIYFNGEHKYQFTLYALDIVLNIASTSTKDIVMKEMDGHVLEKAELIGLAEGEKQS